MKNNPQIDSKKRYTMSYIFKKGKYKGYSVGQVIDEFNDCQYLEFLWTQTQWFNPSIYVRNIIRDKKRLAPKDLLTGYANTARKKERYRCRMFPKDVL